MVTIGMLSNFLLYKLSWFQLVFNFNECNSKIQFLVNTLLPLLYVISSLHPYYTTHSYPYHSFIHIICHIIHSSIHPSPKPPPKQHTRFTNIDVGPLLNYHTFPSLTSYPTLLNLVYVSR